MYQLLAALTDAGDNRDVRHVRIQVKARTTSGSSEAIVEAARKAGANPSSRRDV